MVRLVRFARFARNGAGCTNCRKLDTMRASFRMCKTHMAWLTHEIFDDDGKSIWREGEHYIVIVTWKPARQKEHVEWQFEQDEVDEDIAKLAWILDNPKDFAEKCAAPNVAEADVSTVRDIITNLLFGLEHGDREVLEHLGPILDRLESDGSIESKRARFVDELRERSIAIKAATGERQEKLVSKMIDKLANEQGGYSQAFATLDPTMVKQDVLSIDPHNDKGGRGKKGPPWLGARLIVMANAHEDFKLYRRRPSQTEDDYFKYVLQALQNAGRPNRGKSRSSAKEPR